MPSGSAFGEVPLKIRPVLSDRESKTEILGEEMDDHDRSAKFLMGAHPINVVQRGN